MSKINRPFANAAKERPASTEPQISNTPIVTGSGSMYWNVRDIVFGPNRTSSDDSEKSSRIERKHK